MVDVFAENDGFLHGVGFLQVFGDGLGDQLGALIHHDVAVKVALVVDTVVDQLAGFVFLAFVWPPALQVFVEVDPYDLVRGQIAVVDALLQ